MVMASQFLKLFRVVTVTNSGAFMNRQNNVITKTQFRLRSRWLHRRPIRVVQQHDDTEHKNSDLDKLKIEREALISMKQDEHEIIELDSHSDPELHDSHNFRKKVETPQRNFVNQKDTIASEGRTGKEKLQNKKLPTIHKKSKEEKEATMHMKMEKSAIKLGVPLFTKLEDNDKKLSQVLLIAKSRNKRQTKDLILLEGKRLIKDAIEAGYKPHMVFFSRVEDLKDLEVPENVEVYKTTYKKMSMWSDVVTSPGVMGIFKTPAVEDKKPAEGALPLKIVCDNVRDPGNMGSILRAAAAVGCSKVILTKGCVDLWEPKVLRAGAGAHFRIPIVREVDWDDINNHVSSNSFLLLADNNVYDISADNENIAMSPVPVVPYYAMDYSDLGDMTLIIGGETEGLSEYFFKLARACSGVRVNVPLCNNVDSLNTATALGIIMFEIKRQICIAQQTGRVELSNG